MSSHTLSNLGSLAIKVVVLSVALCFLGDLARAQQPQPPEDQYPKWEAYGGYSVMFYNTRLHAINPFVDVEQVYNARGIGGTLTYNLNDWFGISLDGSRNWGCKDTPVQIGLLEDSLFYNVSVGPKFTYRRKHFAPFAEALVGWHRLTQNNNPIVGSSDAIGFIAGGGVDIPIGRHWGLRPVRADFVYSNHQYEPEALVAATELRGLRLQAGVNFMWGYPDPTAAALSCSLNPSQIMSGEPVSVTATPSYFPDNRKVTYTWTTDGGKVSGTDATVTVDTTGTPAGTYTISAKATNNRNAVAQCSSTFAVTVPGQSPPVISCSPNPGSVMSGEESVITCSCTSPDNRRVSLSAWNASNGTLTPSTGNTARLNTAGTSAGTINVGATCTDDRGLNAIGSAAVDVNVPTIPQARKLNDCGFTNAAKPARVDNACKAALDQVADLLQHEPNAKAVIVGQTEAGETGANLAAQRAVNAKFYLTSGENQKGIDPNRIEVRTGEGGARVEVWIVPEGATFNEPGTAAVDETRIKARK